MPETKGEEKSEVAGFLLSLKNGTSRSPSPEADTTADGDDKFNSSHAESDEVKNDGASSEGKGIEEHLQFGGGEQTEIEQQIQEWSTTEAGNAEPTGEHFKEDGNTTCDPVGDKVDDNPEIEEAPTAIQLNPGPVPIPAQFPVCTEGQKSLPYAIALETPASEGQEVLTQTVLPDPILPVPPPPPLTDVAVAASAPLETVAATEEAVASAAAAAAAAMSDELASPSMAEAFGGPSLLPGALSIPPPFDFDHLLSGSDIVVMKDRDLVPDALFLAIAQMKPCKLAHADRVGCYKSRDIGFLGLCCKHCGGQPGA